MFWPARFVNRGFRFEKSHSKILASAEPYGFSMNIRVWRTAGPSPVGNFTSDDTRVSRIPISVRPPSLRLGRGRTTLTVTDWSIFSVSAPKVHPAV